jgi:hypothetical protein
MKFEKAKRLFSIAVILSLIGLVRPTDAWTAYAILHNFGDYPDHYDGLYPHGSLVPR